MAQKAKVKVTVKTGRKGDAGTLVARIPVTVAKTERPSGQLIYRTKAQMTAHIKYGKRPAKTQFRRIGP